MIPFIHSLLYSNHPHHPVLKPCDLVPPPRTPLPPISTTCRLPSTTPLQPFVTITSSHTTYKQMVSSMQSLNGAITYAGPSNQRSLAHIRDLMRSVSINHSFIQSFNHSINPSTIHLSTHSIVVISAHLCCRSWHCSMQVMCQRTTRRCAELPSSTPTWMTSSAMCLLLRRSFFGAFKYVVGVEEFN